MTKPGTEDYDHKPTHTTHTSFVPRLSRTRMTVWDQYSISLDLAESAVQKTGRPIRLQVDHLRRPAAINWLGRHYEQCIAQKGMVDGVQALGREKPTEEQLNIVTILLAAVRCDAYSSVKLMEIHCCLFLYIQVMVKYVAYSKVLF